MEKDNNSKNLAKLAKLQKQIKSGQEKLKNSVKKLAPPRKKAKREYAHFPARDNEGKLIRLPVRKRKLKDADQNKEEANLTVNVEPSVQHDGLLSTINSKVLKSVDELKIKIEQLRNSTTSDKRTIWEKRKQREMENWANLRQYLFEAVIKTKFANPLNECSKCQNQTVCLIRCQQCAATLCNTCDEDMHTVNALHDRQVKIRYHWADIAPLQSADIDDEGEVIISVAVPMKTETKKSTALATP
ncbi:uncharacterized protein LOC133179727 [Saccostrea echinata]|uniref:uncharacterized protein LOC133179727 n=1 Tax=Saccostrea echinata TaxID=191078 RepID=UPI002A8174FC|nr:uncharacterized protein LOC133179727 [Saccostrea echinata]